MTAAVTIDALLGDQVIEEHAVRLFGRSPSAPFASQQLPEILAEAWERLPEHLQTSFRTNARRDLEAAIATAQTQEAA